MTSYDAVIVGSGPAGSSAAYALAKDGARVLMLEKAALPRYKTCGGGIVGRTLKLLPVSIQDIVESHTTRAELHFLKRGLRFQAVRPQGIISMTMRRDFDYRLACAAQERGAELLAPCEVRDIHRVSGGVEIHTSQGIFKADFVIAADGALSMVAKKAGWKNSPYLIPALECEMTVGAEDFKKFSKAARFDFEIVPGGYAWVFPKKNHLSVGVLSMKRSSVNLQACLKNYLEKLGIGDVLQSESHGYVIPVKPRSGPFASGRVLLAGDAAGFAEPVTGEGISFAVLSGQLAAEAVLKGGGSAENTEALYESLLKKNILPELAAARFFAGLLYGWPGLSAQVFRFLGAELTEIVAGILMGERFFHEILKDPRAYLKIPARWLKMMLSLTCEKA